MSPTTGRPRRAASTATGSRSERPGEITTWDTSSSSESSNAPVRSSASGTCERSVAVPGGSARVSATRTARPLRRR